MSAALLLPYQAAPDAPRKRFTRQEVERLLDLGAFDGQRLELIDGELFDKMGQNPPHADTIQNLTHLFTRMLGGQLVRVQLPMQAGGADRDRSVPEPDVAVLKERKPDFRHRHPRGDELLLAVEVADSSAAFDLTRKAEIYANSGVPEYWVIDLPRGLVVRQREPRNGKYEVAEAFAPGSAVPIGNEFIPVDEILPPTE